MNMDNARPLSSYRTVSVKRPVSAPVWGLAGRGVAGGMQPRPARAVDSAAKRGVSSPLQSNRDATTHVCSMRRAARGTGRRGPGPSPVATRTGRRGLAVSRVVSSRLQVATPNDRLGVAFYIVGHAAPFG